MGNGGHTVSATEFAALTGVSRERLRTWERRFGFPAPTRVGRGPRRYELSDAPRVVAVRRAAEHGVPLAQAIEEATATAPTGVGDATLAQVLAAAPTPVLVIGGPWPLRVLYANGPLAVLPDDRTDRRLDELPWFDGSELETTLRTLFAGDAPVLECTHPAWDGGETTARSLAYRLPPDAGETPAVALVGVDRAQDQRNRRALADARADLAAERARSERLERFLTLGAELAERFRDDAGEAALRATADSLVRRLGAVDVGIGVYMAGELALGSSSRGLLGPQMVTVTGYDDLAELMHTGRPGWLSPAAGGAFGTPADLHALAVPIAVVGETLGLLLLVFDERTALDEDASRLLTIVSATVGFTILRDRLVASRRRP